MPSVPRCVVVERRPARHGVRISILTLALCLAIACERQPGRAAAERSSAPARVVTFNTDVAPILHASCATCHRPAAADVAGRFLDPNDPLCIAGAPFSLIDYESARAHAREIAIAVAARSMPPWLPEAGHGVFANDRRLGEAQIATIQRWVAQGAPEGDPAEKPAPPAFADRWQLGTPDLVLEMPEAYDVAGGTGDVFRNFVIPAPVASARYVRAIEFRTDTPALLHHANIGVDPSRSSRALDRADPGPGFASMPGELVQNVYGWSPGKMPVLEPAETAWTLEEGSDLVVQLHMVARGGDERVRPALGLFFSETPPSRTPVVVKLESKAIDIPAGQADYAIEDRYVLPVDVDAVSVYPHAHALAKEIKGAATLPDGTTVPLIWIRAWDVRWQDQYRYRAPVSLPRGTTVAMRITYDNSDANSRNPHTPPRRVTWGQRSTDEMGALWLEVVPRRVEDVATLTRDYFRRSLQTDIARAEMLVRSDAHDAAARNLLAMKYVEAGRVQEGRTHLEEALRLNPASAEAHSNLGSVLQRQGRLEEATTHLREAVRLDPDDDRVRVNFGNVLLATGRTAEASRELQRAIALNPDNADAHFNLAMVLGPRNQLPEAVWHLGRVLEINPQNGEAHRNLAVALGLQGRIDAAVRHAQRAVRLLPDSAEAREHLGRLLDAQRARRAGGAR